MHLWGRVNGALRMLKPHHPGQPQKEAATTRGLKVKQRNQPPLRARATLGAQLWTESGHQSEEGQGEMPQPLSYPEVSSPASAFHRPSYPGARRNPQAQPPWGHRSGPRPGRAGNNQCKGGRVKVAGSGACIRTTVQRCWQACPHFAHEKAMP